MMVGRISVGISGANGRMGRAIQALLRDDARFELAAKVARSDDWRTAPKLDVVIDFSTPRGFDAALAHCESHGVALVSGTTGIDVAQRKRFDAAAEGIPVLYAANFSLGVAVLARLLREAAGALPDWDVEIVEAHHARKVDAPSGTALALGRAVAEARGRNFDAVAVFGRHGHTGPRQPGTVGFASLRAGDIVGEHTVFIAGHDERIELTHRAYDNAVFARGALHAAAWLAGKPAGAYSLDDVLRP
jgi:4-hydroxy-tetrahydrodipicolinate reductase